MLTYEHYRNMAFHENTMQGGRFEAFLMNTVLADAQMVWICIWGNDVRDLHHLCKHVISSASETDFHHGSPFGLQTPVLRIPALLGSDMMLQLAVILWIRCLFVENVCFALAKHSFSYRQG